MTLWLAIRPRATLEPMASCTAAQAGCAPVVRESPQAPVEVPRAGSIRALARWGEAVKCLGRRNQWTLRHPQMASGQKGASQTGSHKDGARLPVFPDSLPFA